ncbi:putative phage tail protein [Paenibacillus sp. FSL H8-0034]|uniref:putative phage tail protein n=1 Tax=Paenibacillus sp. FSL H8-0034 TaxID=2954671 RepID=UPI0030F6A2C9
MEYLPMQYHGLKEMVEITDTEDIEFDSLILQVKQMLDNQFVMTSNVQAIKRREQQLDIRADPTVEILDFRRKRLIHRYSTRPPFTARYLQNRLDELVGVGVATVDLDIQNFILTIKLKIPDAAHFLEIEHVIRLMKPANLIYYQETALADTLTLVEHMWSTPLHRMTRLGSSWRLGSTPFSIREQEVQIK